MTTRYPRIGEEVRAETLSNGLPVFFVKKPGFRRKYALFGTRYGGMDMRFKRDGAWLDTPAGIAHYLEHKMFDTAEGNALQELALNGAEPNAFTANALTCYYFDCTDKFTENLKILLSFVSLPYFTDESVAKEQGIIAQEIGMIEDSPEWQMYKNLMQCLYHHSPVRTPIAGSVESIAQITAKTLYDCHKAFYTPRNMCLVIVGDVDADAILRMAEEILPKESGEDIPRDYGAAEELNAAQAECRCRMEVSATAFLAGFKCRPPQEGEDYARESILGNLACDLLLGESSPLYARLYREGLINATFSGSYDVLPSAAYLCLGGESKDPYAVVDAVLDEVARLTKEGSNKEGPNKEGPNKEGPEKDYYLRIRNANYGDAIKGLNDFENIAVNMIEGCFHRFDPYRFPEIYDAITEQDVLDFLRENFRRERMAISIVDPKEEV